MTDKIRQKDINAAAARMEWCNTLAIPCYKDTLRKKDEGN